MIPRSTPNVLLALVASMGLASTSGCGSKPTVNDTAEVTPSKSTAEPAKAETPAPDPAPEPAKEAPKG